MIKFPCENNTAFKNAIAWLHTERGVSTVGDTVNAFKSEFNGYLFVDQDWSWDCIMFSNAQDATMFVMRWS